MNQPPARSSGQAVGSSVLWLRSGSVCLTRQASKPARAIAQTRPAADTLGAPGLATMQTESPLGPLMLAATPTVSSGSRSKGMEISRHSKPTPTVAAAAAPPASGSARQPPVCTPTSRAPPRTRTGWSTGVPRERGRRDASLAGVDRLRRPSRLLRSGQHPKYTRPRPAHGRQPHPHRRTLPRRHPRRGDPYHVRRRLRTAPMARDPRTRHPRHRNQKSALLTVHVAAWTNDE